MCKYSKNRSDMRCIHKPADVYGIVQNTMLFKNGYTAAGTFKLNCHKNLSIASITEVNRLSALDTFCSLQLISLITFDCSISKLIGVFSIINLSSMQIFNLNIQSALDLSW